MDDTLFILITVAPLAAIALWYMFSLGLNSDVPSPSGESGLSKTLIADREQLITSLNLELHALEMRLRQSGSNTAAEGAGMMRNQAIEYLRYYKP